MKHKRQAVLLCGLLMLVGAVIYFDVKGPLPAGVLPGTEPYPPLAVENPSLRRDKLRASRETEYKSSGRDLFSDVVAPPVRPKPKRQPDPPPLPVVTPPPPPPQLPVKFYGYGTSPSMTAKRAFLTDGDEIYIVGEGDTLLGRFRILRITNANLEFEEISTGRRGTAPLEEQAAPPA
jgi:hypothetical protein